MWHVERIGKLHTEFLWGGPRERYHCEDVGADRRTILKWIFSKRDGRHELDYCVSG
jgi:hypothetical protein